MGSEPIMGDNKTTQTSSNEPWAPAQPALATGLNDAQTLYRGGIGSQVNTQSNVVPFAQQSSQAFGNMQGNATANMGGRGLSGQMQGMIDRGGFTGDQQNSMAATSRLADSNPYDLSANPAFIFRCWPVWQRCTCGCTGNWTWPRWQ
jgi:hypothetical protein